MSDLTFHLEPPSQWDTMCSSEGRLFQSEAWQNMLTQAFRCRALYAWAPRLSAGLSITVFQIGPAYVGYAGFPIFTVIGKCSTNNEVIQNICNQQFPIPIHLLRMTVSAFADPLDIDAPAICTPETAIQSLRDWRSEELSGSVWRNIKKGRRSHLTIVDADRSHADVLYRLYCETIRRNRGSLRYNALYFRHLVQLSTVTPRLRCLLAISRGEIAGFLVVGLDGATAYYLHGATNPALQGSRPADLLFYEAIAWSQGEGMESFNMMASPASQGSLVRFKEKWGGITRNQRTYSFPINKLYSTLFLVSERLYRLLN